MGRLEQAVQARTRLSNGSLHTLFIRLNGTLWSVGHNVKGQLGDGTTTPRPAPVQVQGLDPVMSVSAGDAHSLAVRADGSLWAWGNNSSGQLGDGTTNSRLKPMRVPGLTGRVVAVAAGYSNSVVVLADGTVWTWGANTAGELGDGTKTARFTPAQVPGLSGIVTVSQFSDHVLALRSDGTVWAWGGNGSGQSGQDGSAEQFTPVQVQGLGGITAVSIPRPARSRV